MKTIIISSDENNLKKIYKYAEQIESIEHCDFIVFNTNDGFIKNLKNSLVNEIDIANVDLFLLSDSDKDQEIASVLTALTNGSCSTNCSKVYTENNKLCVEREVFGGIAYLKLAMVKMPAIISLSSGLLNDQAIHEFNVQFKRIDTKIDCDEIKILSKNKIKKSVDITSAKKIVSVGRGIGQKERIEIIEKLAQKLDAEVGCSRPISEDYRWLPIERQVGLTGETVKPTLYVAVGISGQVQHIVGMRDSKVVVAINNNKSAPIFEYCDYGIVGDLFEIVPILENTI